MSVFGVGGVHSSVLETLAGMVEAHCDSRRLGCAVAVVTTVGFLIGMGQQSVARQASKVPGIESIVVSVELSCPSCAQGLERRLGRLMHVDRVDVDATENEVLLTLNSGQTLDLLLVRDEFRNAGFIPDAIAITAHGEVMRANGQAALKINDETVIPLVASDRTTELMKLGGGRFVTISGTVDIQSDGNQLHVQTADVL